MIFNPKLAFDYATLLANPNEILDFVNDCVEAGDFEAAIHAYIGYLHSGNLGGYPDGWFTGLNIALKEAECGGAEYIGFLERVLSVPPQLCPFDIHRLAADEMVTFGAVGLDTTKTVREAAVRLTGQQNFSDIDKNRPVERESILVDILRIAKTTIAITPDDERPEDLKDGIQWQKILSAAQNVKVKEGSPFHKFLKRQATALFKDSKNQLFQEAGTLQTAALCGLLNPTLTSNKWAAAVRKFDDVSRQIRACKELMPVKNKDGSEKNKNDIHPLEIPARDLLKDIIEGLPKGDRATYAAGILETDHLKPETYQWAASVIRKNLQHENDFLVREECMKALGHQNAFIVGNDIRDWVEGQMRGMYEGQTGTGHKTGKAASMLSNQGYYGIIIQRFLAANTEAESGVERLETVRTCLEHARKAPNMLTFGEIEHTAARAWHTAMSQLHPRDVGGKREEIEKLQDALGEELLGESELFQAAIQIQTVAIIRGPKHDMR